MKVLIDLTSLADNFSGIERFAMSITSELIKRDDMDFVLIFKNEIHKEFVQKRNNVTTVVLKGKNKLWFNQVTLPLGICSIKADYYLFPAFPAPFFFFRKHAISAIHDVSCWDCPGSNKKHMLAYFKVLYRKVAWGKSPIVTVSHFSKDRIAAVLGVKKERIWVIYNGLSEKFLSHNSEQIESDEKEKQIREKYHLPERYLLCLSTLEPRKNMKLLVEAYNDLFLSGSIQEELVLAGRKGWLVDELLATVDSKVREHIHFTGFVDDADLSFVYEKASMFVFPSIYEGFGIPPIEAMSMNTVVVSSDAASMPEILGDAAFYFPSQDKEALKKSILEVLSMTKEERMERVEAGRKQAQQYTWQKSASELARRLKAKK